MARELRPSGQKLQWLQPSNFLMMAEVEPCAGDWHCHECRAAKKAASKGPKPATSTEAVLSEPEAEPKTAAKPARRSAPRPCALRVELGMMRPQCMHIALL